MKFAYEGIVPILPTPFHEDEALDIPSLEKLVKFQQSLGVQGVTVLGILGEANTLTDDEAYEVLAATVESAGGMPVVAGASRYGIRATRVFIERAAEVGAAAVMVAPPSVDGISEATVYQYFQAVCTDSPLPVVIQDHPGTTKVQMSTDLLVRMVDDFDRVIGIKAESVPTAPKVRALKHRAGRVPVLTGLGALYARFDLAAGADGFNTGFAFPEFLIELLRLTKADAWDEAHALYTRYLPLLVLEAQPGPAIRKEIWRRRGILSSARVRSPGGQYDAEYDAVLSRLFEEIGL